MIGEHSHYIVAMTVRNGRYQLSACNAWVLESEHSTTPSCPTCQAYLADDCRELSADDVFGKFDQATTVKPSFAAHADAHYNSYGERRR